MTDGTQTLERCLRLITMLSRYRGYTTTQLADYFGVSIRTIQRDLLKIQHVGFMLIREGDRVKIDLELSKEHSGFDVHNLTQFTSEEAWLLTEAIQNMEGDEAIKERVIKKLSAANNLDELLKSADVLSGYNDVKALAYAIRKGFRIKVAEYTYATANNGLREIILEPFQFAANYSRVWAYYPNKRMNFLLRLSGIAGVKVLYEPYKWKARHRAGEMDVFKGYGFTPQRLLMGLNKRAYGFLLEEHPQAVPSIRKTRNSMYLLDVQIYSYQGVGRFCMSLPGDVQVMEPSGLIRYIEDRGNANNHLYDRVNEVSTSYSAHGFD